MVAAVSADRKRQIKNVTQCRVWFQHFKRGDYDVVDRHGGGKDKIFEDSELKALLAEDPCQTQEEFAESLEVTQQAISKRFKAMGMIQKQGNWVPYELKPRRVERRFFACEQLFQRQNWKEFLYRISALMKKSKNGSIPGSPQNTHRFSEWYPTVARKMEKSSD